MRLLFFLAVAAQFLTQVPTGPGPLTPLSIRERWVADMRSKSLDDVLELYTADATFKSPGADPISGTSALRALYTGVFAKFDADITLETPTQRIEGEPRHFTGIVETGRYSEHLTDRSTHETSMLCGRYIFTYVRNPNGTGWRVSAMDWTAGPCGTN
jgi:ketosteroid isomerase-like protein